MNAEIKIPLTNSENVEISQFITKDSGQRQEFESGMIRDLQIDKLGWHRVADGPMLKRWAELDTRGNMKYPDVAPGKPNWTLANSETEYQRFRESAFRHFMEWWYNNNPEEDAAAGVFFNINGAEFVKEKLNEKKETK